MARESALARLPLPAKFLVGFLLLGLVGVVYLVTVYTDLASSINAQESQEQALRKDLVEAQKAEYAYQRDLADLTEREQRQKELNKILPSSTEHAAFLSSIQSVANATGVDLIAWTPQEEVVDEFYARVPMRLEFRGRYHQIAKFFYGVGQLERIINMENIALTDPDEQAEEINVNVEALATAFKALDPTQAVAEGSDKRDKAIGGQK